MTSASNGIITDHLSPPELRVAFPSSYFPLLRRRSSAKSKKSSLLLLNVESRSETNRSGTARKFSDPTTQGFSANESIFSSESSREPSRCPSRLSSLSSDFSDERNYSGVTHVWCSRIAASLNGMLEPIDSACFCFANAS